MKKPSKKSKAVVKNKNTEQYLVAKEDVEKLIAAQPALKKAKEKAKKKVAKFDEKIKTEFANILDETSKDPNYQVFVTRDGVTAPFGRDRFKKSVKEPLLKENSLTDSDFDSIKVATLIGQGKKLAQKRAEIDELSSVALDDMGQCELNGLKLSYKKDYNDYMKLLLGQNDLDLDPFESRYDNKVRKVNPDGTRTSLSRKQIMPVDQYTPEYIKDLAKDLSTDNVISKSEEEFIDSVKGFLKAKRNLEINKQKLSYIYNEAFKANSIEMPIDYFNDLLQEEISSYVNSLGSIGNLPIKYTRSEPVK